MPGRVACHVVTPVSRAVHVLSPMCATDLRGWVSERPEDFPDVVFLINVGDVSYCNKRAAARGRPCPVPVLSLIKEWDRNRWVPRAPGEDSWGCMFSQCCCAWRSRSDIAGLTGGMDGCAH